jgi:hypothetical protein
MFRIWKRRRENKRKSNHERYNDGQDLKEHGIREKTEDT